MLTGRRADQGGERAALPLVEAAEVPRLARKNPDRQPTKLISKTRKFCQIFADFWLTQR